VAWQPCCRGCLDDDKQRTTVGKRNSLSFLPLLKSSFAVV
jgi:hypothetical protein